MVSSPLVSLEAGFTSVNEAKRILDFLFYMTTSEYSLNVIEVQLRLYMKISRGILSL